MSRYIDADKMIEDLETISQFAQNLAIANALSIDSIVEYIEKHRLENEDVVKSVFPDYVVKSVFPDYKGE